MSMENIKTFAIIDTETNWCNEVMSIGVAIAECETFELVDTKYYILTPECLIGGMFSSVLLLNDNDYINECSRSEAITDLTDWFDKNNVQSIFAYNAFFDYSHLKELSAFRWYDIIKVAAYRQYNSKIPQSAECCKTGRLKRNYGVEPMMRMLSGDYSYFETHNALSDALDELKIMQLLGFTLDKYDCAVINSKKGY